MAIKTEVTPQSAKNDSFLRLWQIVGCKEKGVVPLLPISKSAWWAGIREGRYPKGVKLSARTTVWRRSEVLALIAGAGE